MEGYFVLCVCVCWGGEECFVQGVQYGDYVEVMDYGKVLFFDGVICIEGSLFEGSFMRDGLLFCY